MVRTLGENKGYVLFCSLRCQFIQRLAMAGSARGTLVGF